MRFWARPRLSVGRIEGGESVNVVPDWCEVEVDRRLIPGEDPAESLREVREWLIAHLTDEIRHSSSASPGFRCRPLASASQRGSARSTVAIEAATGRRPALRGVPFGTDAGPLSASGNAVRRLRPRRHRAGAYQGRMDRPRPGRPGRRSLFPDRRRAGLVGQASA